MNRHSPPDIFDGDLLAKTLRAIMEARCMSMHQAATAARLSVATLSRISADKVPDVESFARLCHWMQVAPSFFFRREDT